MSRHFRVSPLLASVPLDGSETVSGLRSLAYEHCSGVQQHTRQALIKQAALQQQRAADTRPRPHYRRFRGPYLEQLDAHALHQMPRSWRQFWGIGARLNEAWNVPEHTDMMVERMEENIIVFLANYIWLAGGLALVLVCLRWQTAFGFAAIAFTIWFNVKYPAEGLLTQRVDPLTGQAQPPPTDELAAPRSMLTISCWILIVWTRGLMALLFWLLVSSLVILAHASARCAPSEWTEQPRPGVPIALFISGQPSIQHPAPQRLWLQLRSMLAEQAGILQRWGRYWQLVLWDMVRFPRLTFQSMMASPPTRT